MEIVAECEAVTHIYATKTMRTVALQDINLKLTRGEIVALLGPSGCGKTTLLNLFAGFAQASVGEVRVDGKTVVDPSPDRMVIFQGHSLFDWMSVYKNIKTGLYASTEPKQQKHERVLDMISLVKLSGFDKHYPAELSGGMMQRVGIARALAPRPQMLLMDEPFGALDAITRETLQDDVSEIFENTAMSGILVTHSAEEAAYLGDTICIMSSRPGRITRELTNPVHRQQRTRTGKEYGDFVRLVREAFKESV